MLAACLVGCLGGMPASRMRHSLPACCPYAATDVAHCLYVWLQVQLDSMAAANPAFPIILAAGPVSSGGFKALPVTVHGFNSAI
jgi:hypothetical protein